MSTSLNSLGEMALVLVEREAEAAVVLEGALGRVLEMIEGTARSEFGVYQPARGPFPAWAELAESTKDDRTAQGYTDNEPLLREGDLMNSLGHEQHALEGAVGSTSEIMPYHEFGTSRMPARPVLGPALFRNRDRIRRLLGFAAVAAFIGVDRVHRLLGYDDIGTGSGRVTGALPNG